MRNKKAISPLIATVLLIGFTIVLAVLIFRWIGPILTGTQKEIGCNVIVGSACVNNVDIGIIGATLVDATAIEMNIENKGTQKIDGIIFRITDSNGDISSQVMETAGLDELDPYGSKRYTFTVTDTALVTKVEAIPKISALDPEGTLCKRDCTEKSVSTTTFT